MLSHGLTLMQYVQRSLAHGGEGEQEGHARARPARAAEIAARVSCVKQTESGRPRGRAQGQQKGPEGQGIKRRLAGLSAAHISRGGLTRQQVHAFPGSVQGQGGTHPPHSAC